VKIDPLQSLLDNPLPFLAHDDDAVRRLAVAACSDRLDDPAVVSAVTALVRSDPAPTVRTEAIEVLSSLGSAAFETVIAATTDLDERVVEAAATALGEIASIDAVDWLLDAASGHEDRLVREAAVASLGAIGDPRAVPTLLALLVDGPPQIRRRAVVALTVFDDPSIEPALRTAAEDRNPMVREVAEMVVGRPPDTGWRPVQLGPRGG
jgi:HEAT repeat protein